MQELATITISTETDLCFVVLLADLRFEIARQMLLLAELVSSMGKRAPVQPLAGTVHLPVLAHLCLKFLLIRSDEADPFRSVLELSLGQLGRVFSIFKRINITIVEVSRSITDGTVVTIAFSRLGLLRALLVQCKFSNLITS